MAPSSQGLIVGCGAGPTFPEPQKHLSLGLKAVAVPLPGHTHPSCRGHRAAVTLTMGLGAGRVRGSCAGPGGRGFAETQGPGPDQCS